MGDIAHDRVKETSTTTGTGDITLLGAVAQFQPFSIFPVGQPFYYGIVGQAGTEWEVGLGTLTNSTTLQRLYVTESSNANGLVSFSAGTKDVFNTISASRINRTPTIGTMVANFSGYAMP